MAKREHRWNTFEVCDICGCHRIWGEYIGFWRFVWEDGRVFETRNGTGAPACEGFSARIVEACLTAMMGAEKSGPKNKVIAILNAYQDTVESLAKERDAERARKAGK